MTLTLDVPEGSTEPSGPISPISPINPDEFVDALETSPRISTFRTKHESESDEDEASETSTLVYDHEPFEKYKSRVVDLCHSLWPPSTRQSRLLGNVTRLLRLKWKSGSKKPTTMSFNVERMKGGINRVIAVTTVDALTEERKEYILRIPRYKDAHVDREVAVLDYIRKHSKIPIPDVAAKDFTVKNALSSPYVMQHRIPGLDLQNSSQRYPNLNLAQKKDFVKQFGKILAQIMEIRGAAPGQVKPSKNPTSQGFSIQHFDLANPVRPGWVRKFDDLSTSQDPPSYAYPLDFFISQLDRWRTVTADDDVMKPAYFDQLTAMATQMEAAGFLGDGEYCLAHLDLATAPRNVLAVLPSDDTLEITGILDWDEALFAPKFVGCVAPMWIWAWSDEEDEDETKANAIPDDPDMQELKRLFEEAVGAEYLKYCYEPPYRLARTLFQVVLHGMHSNDGFERADELIEDWASMRPEGTVEIESPRILYARERDSSLYQESV